jgi:GNAT superfamily N-acetyltransferase
LDWYIKSYDLSDAAGVAQMWNESDEGWPGGFTGGVPFTEERVRQWKSEERYIDIFLVVADGKVVAYCSLFEYGMEPTAAYVALLNCHPQYWKHGFGRELLKKAVARSTELGYKRLDLHTWSGNLRAVPLYKKTGFFWQPETQVHMLNFLPLILPLARDFFADVDWYKIYQRELEQKEDDIIWRGMKAYPYSFNNNGRMLKVIIDRESRGMTAFENDDFSVACLVEGQELVAGVASPVRWEIINKKTSPLAVSLLASGEDGLSISKRATFEVSDQSLIESDVTIDRDIIAHQKDEPAHKITTTLVVDGHLLVLETGVRPQQAVEIAAAPAYVSLTPGLPRSVSFRLKSNLKQPARVSLALLPPANMTIDQPLHTVDLPAGGIGGVTGTMLAREAGAPSIQAAITAETEQGKITVKPVLLPVAAPGPGKPVAYLRQDEAIIENQWTRLVVSYRAAHLTVYRKEDNTALVFQRSTIGPPFYPSEFRSVRFAARITEQAGAMSLSLSASSRLHPGVTFERIVSLDSSAVVTVTHRLHNSSSQEQNFQIQAVHSGRLGELTLALPTAQGVVVDLAPSFPDWYDDEGRKPESLAESWMALNGDGFVVGVIWSGAIENSMDSWERPNLKIDVPVLPAYGHVDAPPIHLYAGAGDWRDVRRTWRALVNPDAPASRNEQRRVLSATTAPSPLVVIDGKSETALHLDNQRSRGISGSLQIAAPQEWTVAPASANFQDIKRGHPLAVPISVRRARGKGPGASEGAVSVRHDFSDEQFPLPLIALGRRGGVDLKEFDQQGRKLVAIDNGWMRLVVAPDHIGSLIALEQGGVNHLHSSYPTARAFSWSNPWHGGVSAVIMAPDDDNAEPGNPGRMFLESWSHELLPARRGAAVPWTGVRVSSNLTREDLRGLRLEIDYLTVGQSNVLAVLSRLVNTTTAPFQAMLVTQAFVQPGGDCGKAVLYAGQQNIRRVPGFLWGGSGGSWAGIAHADSGQCLAMIAARGGGQVIALDYGSDGAHLFNTALPAIAPLGTYETLTYLVLAPDVAQARLYRWLEHWPWPAT